MPESSAYGLWQQANAERLGSLNAQERAVERAIGDLVNYGAIERANRAGNGKRAAYRLTLFNAIHIDGRPVDSKGQPDTQGYP